MRKGMKQILLQTSIVALALTCVSGFATLPKQEASAENALIAMKDGAACRVTETKSSGLKYTANIEKTDYDKLVETYTADKVSAGIIIVPYEYVTQAEGYTFNAFANAELEVGYQETNEFAEKNGAYSFSCTIIDILDANYTRDFAGIAYVKVETDETIEGYQTYNNAQYYYASFNEENNVRNIYEIAYEAYSDRNAECVTIGEMEYKYEVEDTQTYSPYNTTQLGTLKDYADGVLNLTYENGALNIANNGEYYTSPYTVSEDVQTEAGFLTAKNTYSVNYSSEPKSVLYNGERIKDFTTNNGAIEFTETVKYEVDGYVGVEYNRATATYTDGNDYIDVTLQGNAGNWTTTNQGADLSIYNTDLSYVAFSGNEYKLGDMISLDFKGNYIPMLGFYMNGGNYNTIVNSDATGETGCLMLNGATNADGSKQLYARFNERLTVVGPNRITGKMDGHTDTVYLENYGTAFSAASLDSTKTYRILVGCINDNGVVKIVGYLFEHTDSGLSLVATLGTATVSLNKLTSMQASAFTYSGKMIVYGAMNPYETKIRFNNKVVTYSESNEDIVTFKDGKFSWNVEGATGYLVDNGTLSYTTNTTMDSASDVGFTLYSISDTSFVKYTHEEDSPLVAYKSTAHDVENKSVTLTTTGIASQNYTDAAYTNNAYLAFKGEYGLNTRVDFFFKGNNMPQVCLFADKVTEDMTDGSGFLAINGFCKADGSNGHGSNWNQRFVVYGPNKMSDTKLDGATDRYIDCKANTDYSYTTMGMANLDANTNYKYSIFTYKHVSNGYIQFKIQLWTIAEDGKETRVYAYENTGSTQTKVAADTLVAGNIICYAPVKGTGTATFTYVMPYACDNLGNPVTK